MKVFKSLIIILILLMINGCFGSKQKCVVTELGNGYYSLSINTNSNIKDYLSKFNGYQALDEVKQSYFESLSYCGKDEADGICFYNNNLNHDAFEKYLKDYSELEIKNVEWKEESVISNEYSNDWNKGLFSINGKAFEIYKGQKFYEFENDYLAGHAISNVDPAFFLSFKQMFIYNVYGTNDEGIIMDIIVENNLENSKLQPGGSTIRSIKFYLQDNTFKIGEHSISNINDIIGLYGLDFECNGNMMVYKNDDQTLTILFGDNMSLKSIIYECGIEYEKPLLTYEDGIFNVWNTFKIDCSARPLEQISDNRFKLDENIYLNVNIYSPGNICISLDYETEMDTYIIYQYHCQNNFEDTSIFRRAIAANGSTCNEAGYWAYNYTDAPQEFIKIRDAYEANRWIKASIIKSSK